MVRKIMNEKLSRDACFVVGAGLTSAAVGKDSPLASWTNLIQDGINHLEKMRDLDKSGAAALRTLLFEADDSSSLLAVADLLKDSFNSQQEFRNWLSALCKNEKINNSNLIDKLLYSGKIIITTNYDDILERRAIDIGIDVVSLTWRDVGKVKLAFSNEEMCIFHIHGYYKDPASIIFTSDEYEKLASSNGSEIFQSLLMTRQLIFLAVGEGIRDLDFTSQFETFMNFAETGENNDLFLCSSRDLGKSQIICKDYQLQVVPYGNRYTELPQFIDNLLLQSQREQQDLNIEKRLEKGTGDYKEIFSIKNGADLICPCGFIRKRPTLFSTEKERKKDYESGAFNRISSKEIIKCKPSVILISAQGVNSGLTTALLTIAAENHDKTKNDIINLSYKTCSNDLESAINERLARPGVDPKSLLITIDDVLTTDNQKKASIRTAKSFLKSLKSIQPFKCFLGCRDSQLQEIFQLLNECGIEYSTYYLDSVRKKDINRLAKVCLHESTEDGDNYAQIVYDTMGRMNLPRTYMNAELLLSIVKSSPDIVATASSQAILLQAFCDKLAKLVGDRILGTNITPRDIHRVLAKIAETMIRKDVQVIEKSEVNRIVVDFFKKQNIETNSDDFLSLLTQVHIFSEFNDKATKHDMLLFSRASYLLLYGALFVKPYNIGKSGEEFLDYLLSNSLHYANVIEMFTELDGTSSKVLKNVVVEYEKVEKEYLGKVKVDFSEIAPSDISDNAEMVDGRAMDPIEAEAEADSLLDISNGSQFLVDQVFQASDSDDFSQKGIYISTEKFNDSLEDKWFFVLNFLSLITKWSNYLDEQDDCWRNVALQEIVYGWGMFFLLYRNSPEAKRALLSAIKKISADEKPIDYTDYQLYSYIEASYWSFLCMEISNNLATERLGSLINDIISINQECSDYKTRCPNILSCFIFILATRPNKWKEICNSLIKSMSSILNQPILFKLIKNLLSQMYITGFDLQNRLMDDRDLNGILSLFDSLQLPSDNENRGLDLKNLKLQRKRYQSKKPMEE
ncbi:SIR2 family protein [Bifidobacterium sp. ESL0800]|uniref:SIR2 family NAD-dependent protein deacylase n=1 Tax=Bifidobacterium sp. ESL0800 TaxID=2983236 RepID=UPI0023F720D0|nr:SIR2 family protein [Bifidobacterium sp. ESL0800]WEV75844.1 SIR2 family protein [Bifidobacterium sp. ESL0800]